MKQSAKRILPAIILVGIVLVSLELLNFLGLIQDFFIPAPSAVLKVMIEERQHLQEHIYTTSYISILGLLLAVPIGAIIAIILNHIPILYHAVYPLVLASQTIPTIVITPIIVIMFGFGTWPRMLVVILVCFFPLTISFMQGLSSVDPDILRLMRTLKASSWQTLYHVLIPGALPAFLAGLKIAATYCVTAAVLSEWSGSGSGLGIFLMRTRRSYAYDKMFAAIAWIVILSLIIYLSVIFLEYFLLQRKKRNKKT